MVRRSPYPDLIIRAYSVKNVIHRLLPMIRPAPVYPRNDGRMCKIGDLEAGIVSAESKPSPYLNQSIV